MKKVLKFLLISLALSSALVSCEYIDSQHNHKYSKTWTTTETEHWRVASCEHTDLVVNKGTHTFDSGMKTKSPTEEEEGVYTYTCTVCKYTKDQPISRLPHTHKYEETFSYNDGYHWKEPTCGHIGAKELSPHNILANVCLDCGYMTESQGLAYKLSNTTYTVTGRGSCTNSCVVIPATYNGLPVTAIGDYAFAGENNLTIKVVIPSTIEKIGAHAFETAEGLEEVIFKGESSLTSIGAYAFNRCDSALTSFTVPKSVTKIGEGAFLNCVKLERFIVEEGNTAFKEVDGNLYSIDGTKLLQYAIANTRTEYTVPKEVTSIGVGAFAYSPYLTKITFDAESTMTALPEEAFHFALNLKELTIPTGITSIGKLAFGQCQKLETLNVPANVKTIGNEAFINCFVLPGFAIPSTVTSIGERAFAYCNGFTTFDIPSSVTTLGDEVMIGCENLVSVTIPASVTRYGSYMFRGSQKLQRIEVAEGNRKLQSIDGHLYTKDGKTLIYYCVANPATSFTVPQGVTEIKDYAFYVCNNLVNVELPTTLQVIGSNAFFSCEKLESVNLPEGLTTVGKAAFRECIALKEISFPSTLKTISVDMLFGCTSLRSLTIPATVTRIEKDALAYLPLTTLVFENTAGWSRHYTTDKGSFSAPISEDDLKDNAKAITLITVTHCADDWVWSQP